MWYLKFCKIYYILMLIERKDMEKEIRKTERSWKDRGAGWRNTVERLKTS